MSIGFNPARVNPTAGIVPEAAAAAAAVSPGSGLRGSSPASTLASSSPPAKGICGRLRCILQAAGNWVATQVKTFWNWITCQVHRTATLTLEQRIVEGGKIIDAQIEEFPVQGVDFRVVLFVMKYNNQVVTCMRKVNESMGQVSIDVLAKHFLKEFLSNEANANVHNGQLEIETVFFSRDMSALISVTNSAARLSCPSGALVPSYAGNTLGLTQEELLVMAERLLPHPEDRPRLLALLTE